MKISAVLLACLYVVLLCTKSEEWSLGLELALDLLAIGAAVRCGRKLVAAAFACTLISTSNFQVLQRVFHVELSKTMGTWLELEINAPYVGCFAFAALALIAWARPDRKQVTAGVMLSLAAFGLSLAAFLPALNRTGYHVQNRVLHVVCFAVSALVYGFGVVSMAQLDQPRRALVAAGFVSIALSGLFFQVTEIFPKAYALDTVMDLTWTLGQLAAVAGLLAED